MQDMFGLVRRSFVLRPSDGEESSPGTLVDKINCIRKSIAFSRGSPPPPISKDATPTAPSIRWRKGELIGCGAFGHVYMGMNLDSGELLAVKQVLITTSNATKERAQAHIRELEEEVKLLKNLSHPNIVRYLGTVREEDTLNILLEFVPGGSISSLLGKFGSFPETVIRMYTKQLLLGLDYLHNNGIMHRDIKGANILVDNKGCIKLADFGASKQVVELATISGAKSMKGTPYWMAPEVILQTGHSFSADMWSVGCTVIEMATGKPPWSQQYQEVAALFHIGTTKSHPPIPAHLSAEGKDFLLKCLQKEPYLRPTALELLKHPFVTGKYTESQLSPQTSVMENSETPVSTSEENLPDPLQMNNDTNLLDVCEMGNLSCSTGFPENSEFKPNWGASNDDDMCLTDDKDDIMVVGEVKFNSNLQPDNVNESFNPISEPVHDWSCEFDGNLRPEQSGMDMENQSLDDISACGSGKSNKGGHDFSYPSGPSVSDDDDVTESKIREFLDEKAIELKKLQTPLYEEYYNTINGVCSPSVAEHTHDDNVINYLKLPPKSRSPSRPPIGTPSVGVDSATTVSPGSCGKRMSNIGIAGDQTVQDTPSPPRNDWKGRLADAQQEPNSASVSFSEIQRKWKEELDQELERKREMMRQAGVGGKTSSPKDRALNRTRERSRFASPGK